MKLLRHLLLLIVYWGCTCAASLGSESPNSESSLTRFDIRPEYRQRIEDRSRIDRYIASHYLTETHVGINPVQPQPRRANERRGTIRTLHTRWPDRIVRDRVALPEQVRPKRGYRPSLFKESSSPSAITLNKNSAGIEGKAARLIEERLAGDGLLSTLSQVFRTLGADYLKGHPNVATKTFDDLGFPVDLLNFFSWGPNAEHNRNATERLQVLWNVLSQAQSMEPGLEVLKTAEFSFPASLDTFRVATESGDHPIGLLRLQLGGGLSTGVILGSSVDFAGQLVETVPEVNLLASVTEEYFEICRWLAGRVWPLRRTGHLTLIGEPMRLSPWAQDNAKAGTVISKDTATNRWAMLTPRYASVNEVESTFVPGDSFGLEGLAPVGIEIAQSPLLFQGGNLQAVREPRSRRRLLLVGEGEVARNRELGLSASQVLQAFRIEFGVDECKVIPSVSYHLDYDVNFRAKDGQLVAFVNDPLPAARIMVRIATERLVNAALGTAQQAEEIYQALASRQDTKTSELMLSLLGKFRNADGRLADKLATAFRVDDRDAPTSNLQCLLVAMDFLQTAQEGSISSALPAERTNYLMSIRRTLAAIHHQKRALAELGFKLVEIPSFPDVRRSINYLNGVHDQTRYLMPAFGGFYAPLDQAAKAAFEAALGKDVKVVELFCAQAQLNYGAVHCMLSPFPDLAAQDLR